MKQCLYAALFILFLLNLLNAQAPTTGELAGIVINDEQVPIQGATIYIVGPQGDQTTTTGRDGSYVFRLLPVGTYTVVASATGHTDRKLDGIEVRLNDRTRCEVVLLRGLKEEVTVRAPAIDVTQSTVNIQIPASILEQVPVGRSVGEVALLTASATPNQGATGANPGKHNPSISGSTGLENTYIIDGINVGDTGFGGLGAYSFRHASFGSGVTFNFIETIEIMSSGFGAEYGNSTGGVINVLTKSGTNNLHGSVFGYMTPDGLRGDYNYPLLENRSVHAVSGVDEWDAGFEVGGPILKDRLFFFAAYNPQSRTIRKIPDPATELAPLGEREIDEFRNAYSSKLSWNLSQNHDVVFSFFGDPGDASVGPQMSHPHNYNENPNYESALKFGSNTQVVRYNGILTPSLILEAQAGRSSTHYEEDLPPQWDRHFFIDATGGLGSQGGPGYYDKRDGENLQLQVKATSFFEAMGSHSIKVGTSLDNVDYLGTNLYSGPSGVQFSDATGNQYTYDSGLAVFKLCANESCSEQIYQVLQGFLNNTPNDTESQVFSLFVEDTWQPHFRLALTFGLRADRQKIHGGGDPKTLPGGSVVEFRTQTFELWDHLSSRFGHHGISRNSSAGRST